jgi:excisionase family DNA binding protein
MSVRESDELLKIGEVAEELRLHPMSVWRRVADGSLPCVRLGNGKAAPIRIPRRELDLYLRQGTRRAAA